MRKHRVYRFVRMVADLAITLFLWNGLLFSASILDLRFDTWSVEDGLSENTVYTICQDYQGFIWFGTSHGLNRFDGYEFVLYEHIPRDSSSISDNYITRIYEDKDSILWIGTSGGGVNRFNMASGAFSRFMHDPDNGESLSNNTVRCILEDQKGFLWIGTDGGLNRFDKKSGVFTHYFADSANGLSHNRVLSIYEDPDGILWLGTGNGLNRFDPETEHFTVYQKEDDKQSLAGNLIWRIEPDADDSDILWLATYNRSLTRFNKKTGRAERLNGEFAGWPDLPDYNVISVLDDRQGRLWIGAEGGGLFVLDKNKRLIAPYYLDASCRFTIADNTIWSIYQDRSGLIWLGTDNGGVSRFAPSRMKFNLNCNSPKNSNSLVPGIIQSIYKDKDGIIWAGSHGYGLSRINRDTGEFLTFKHEAGISGSLADDDVRAILEDSRGNLWIGTSNGLNRFNREQNKFDYYTYEEGNPNSISHSIINTLYNDKSGKMWIGTQSGIALYDPQEEKFIQIKKESDQIHRLTHYFVRAITEDQKGYIWIGTESGLNRLTPESGFVKCYLRDPNDPNSLSNNEIYSLYADSSGYIWIGTENGLNRYDPKLNYFRHYFKSDGLPDNSIYSILPDLDGNLWLSTNMGLSKFDPVNESFQNYDAFDGLQSNRFMAGAGFAAADGELFFGGINGLNSFNPRFLLDNTYVPPVVLSKFMVFDKDFIPAEQIESITEILLNYHQNQFTFEFAVLDYTNPGENQYAYFLEGLDSNWHYIGTNRRGSYTNLKGGTYILHLKGSNSDGIWNETGKSIKIVITPPLWDRLWFRILLIILLILMIILVIHFRERIIRRQKELLEKEVAERTAQLKEKQRILEEKNQELSLLNEKKNQLLGMAAHDLRNPLTGINGYVGLLKNTIEMDLYSKEDTLADLDKITAQIHRMSRLIDDILDISAIESGKISLNIEPVNYGDILRESIAFHERVANQKKISLIATSIPSELKIALDRERIQEVIDNILGNAIKYTYPGGQVTVRCQAENGFVSTSISDTGQGLYEHEINDLFTGFKKLSAKPTGGESSSGLGLAIAKKIVEMHKGQIFVKSRKGEGSVFVFAIPMNLDDMMKNSLTLGMAARS